MKVQKYSDISLLLLRISLGALFLYFGLLAVTDPEGQLSWMSTWVNSLPVIGTPVFIFVFGIVQIIIALCLILGIYVRYAALAAGAALIGIIINLGFNDVAYRDVVILTAALVLATQLRFRWALYPGS